MGRGADGGCGTEERPCHSIVGPKKIEKNSDDVLITESAASSQSRNVVVVDTFSQARKALCELGPNDGPEDGNAASSQNLSVPTLPFALANLLKQADSRKKHKKSHSGAGKKSSARQGEKAKGRNIWVETEEYFRDLALPDIDTLHDVSRIGCLDAKKGFLIPYLKNETNESNVCPGTESVAVKAEDANGFIKNTELKEEDNEQSMEIDSVGACDKEESCVVPDSDPGLEWILGSKTRTLLTSDKPSKKRKLLGSDAGLEKLLIGRPCDKNPSLCHYCCKGDLGLVSNQLIVCSSCQAAVHQKCYGVQGVIDGSWLCSWCNQQNNINDLVKQPCVFCPKTGGALKPVSRIGEKIGAVEFAHLFCSLLMPDVYIDDLTKMEPIENVEGINETRKKLICNVCKVKCGACVRCTNGVCRASFHPLCAREAGHRVEVWGKYGCNKIELRAFCSKHSTVHDSSRGSKDPDFDVGDELVHKLKKSRKDGDTITSNIGSPDTISDKLNETDSQETGLSSSMQDPSEFCDEQLLNNTASSVRSSNEDDNTSLNFTLLLKKLIDRGKVNVKDVAKEIGMTPDELAAKLPDEKLSPHMHNKIVKWVKNHAYLGALQKNGKVKLSSHSDIGAAHSFDDVTVSESNISDAVTVSESNISDAVTVKSVPPRRRTKILRDNRVKTSADESLSDKEVSDNDEKVDQLITEGSDNLKEGVADEKLSYISLNNRFRVTYSLDMFLNTINHDGCQDFLAKDFPETGGHSNTPLTHTLSGAGQLGGLDPQLETDKNVDQENSVAPSVSSIVPDLIKPEIRQGETSFLEASSNASICCDHQINGDRKNKQNLEQLIKARKMGVLDLCAQDEVEGEIIYFQHRLLSNEAARKQLTDNLVHKVSQSLPKEIDVARGKKWDSVLANQYLRNLRDAKKQGRKEKKHKEAQADLAAKRAAVATSSRISSFRKDAPENSHQEISLNPPNGRASVSSQLMTRPKETVTGVAGPRVSFEKYSDSVQPVSEFSKDHPKSCDICRRSETLLNPILVCYGCKVGVHLDCYRSVNETPGPWYCELCEELSSRTNSAPSANFWEKPYFFAECFLCGGSTGAFRKSSGDHWVHAFCAEWVFETTFRRGQVNPVEGLEAACRGVDICRVCRRQNGICIRCNQGQCQIKFHPTCARSAGFYMNVKASDGKLQHKAYCDKHSLEQKAKGETQKHGTEELKTMKQVRVELERLRLLCERIVKREKLKRELVLCSHNILECKRDQIARSMAVYSPVLPDVSSESATTSLKGHTDGSRSQRSDGVTVDSTFSVKLRTKNRAMVTDTDQKTDDSSTSQNLFIRKPTERMQFAGKQIPNRPFLGRTLSDDGELSSQFRKSEVLMTSDEASVKNQRLVSRGFAYVPLEAISNEKQMNQEACSGEAMDEDE
ncbi:hypothetical protein ACFE04_015562 [Oxalis oulophora]